MARPPRIWLSTETPAKGEIVRVRAQTVHTMETGFRFDAEGRVLPQDTMTAFRTTLNDDLLLDWQPERAIAQNPYIEFTFAARQSGTLRMVWTDDSGDFAEAEREITLQG
ncbi:MAG: thiosulfate oxidation carrier complex protein SoxZ [Paracoccus sp. (in: a-proteobacteria)]|uniref:thiosulfate oxidation carrier complex protein SoxZ n=1 Tax=Paracoccus sp. TaxID=267 RepID=UPI0026E104C9|nr:thiosulfate oxidation carrier complex protein SoxZ [Paracoccus sp. (in: a-proteobacteria)]MDO5622487.1 thiosulfate oxidation carrier complex protein SoxZ [Paracoccus sp. (in: a-proteobacteria)]